MDALRGLIVRSKQSFDNVDMHIRRPILQGPTDPVRVEASEVKSRLREAVHPDHP